MAPANSKALILVSACVFIWPFCDYMMYLYLKVYTVRGCWKGSAPDFPCIGSTQNWPLCHHNSMLTNMMWVLLWILDAWLHPNCTPPGGHGHGLRPCHAIGVQPNILSQNLKGQVRLWPANCACGFACSFIKAKNKTKNAPSTRGSSIWYISATANLPLTIPQNPCLTLSWPFPATSLKTMINSKWKKNVRKKHFENAF